MTFHGKTDLRNQNLNFKSFRCYCSYFDDEIINEPDKTCIYISFFLNRTRVKGHVFS